jgi:hypothetical protein
MNIIKFTLPTLLVLAGCAQHQIVNRANPSANWNADVYQCSQAAASAFPPMPVASQPQQNPSLIETARLTPEQRLSLIAMQGGRQAGNALAQARQADPNAANRQQHLERCLLSRGWQREMIQR